MISNTLTTNEIYTLVQDNMAATEVLMYAEMQSEIPLAELVMTYAVGNGGKRFRPLLTLLSAGLCRFNQHQYAVIAAAFIEFIHNATLLHDDVVDQSDMRRGKSSANVAFGNAASVLVGDFLYTRAFQLMVRTGNEKVIAMMADAVNLIAAGEVMQLDNMHDPDVDEKRYYRVIELKTAVLFSASCKVAGILAQCSEEECEALALYGQKLGMAFQIMDDLLDYTGNEATIGKSLGDDLAEGKPTLPLIRAQQQLSAPEKLRLRNIIEQGKRDSINEVMTMLNKTDALQYSRNAAKRLAEDAIKALNIFAENKYKIALQTLAYQAINREY